MYNIYLLHLVQMMYLYLVHNNNKDIINIKLLLVFVNGNNLI